MDIDKKVEKYIMNEFGSIKEFSRLSKIPYSTVLTMFKNGILKSRMPTIIQMTDFLEIDINSLISGKIVKVVDLNKSDEEFYKIYESLSDIGKAKVQGYAESVAITYSKRYKNE